jgi:hypothetical protein
MPADSQIFLHQSSTREGLVNQWPNRVAFLCDRSIQVDWRNSLTRGLRRFVAVVHAWAPPIVSYHRAAEADLEKAIDFTA